MPLSLVLQADCQENWLSLYARVFSIDRVLRITSPITAHLLWALLDPVALSELQKPLLCCQLMLLLAQIAIAASLN